MRRVLIRAGKSPFQPATALETLDKNLFGHNNGNYLFADAVFKLLSTPNTEVEAGGYVFHAKHAEKVRREYDVVVLPMANLFHPSRKRSIDQLTGFVAALDIPVLLMGVGAQIEKNGTYDDLAPIEKSVRRFCDALVDHGSPITVRSDKTAGYLDHLGVKKIRVTGCPSLSLAGPALKIGNPTTSEIKKIGYNIAVNKSTGAAAIADAESSFDATYYPQDPETLSLMIWGYSRLRSSLDKRLPAHVEHKQFSENKAKFMLDTYTWIRTLRDEDLSFGPRIHGNIAAILAGVPAVLLAHDMRTLELAEYHHIPHFSPEESDGVTSVADIIECVDYTEFNKKYPDYFRELIGIVESFGLDHIYQEQWNTYRIEYEKKLAETSFLPPLTTQWSNMSVDRRELLARTRQIELRQAQEIAMLKNSVKQLSVAK